MSQCCYAKMCVRISRGIASLSSLALDATAADDGRAMDTREAPMTTTQDENHKILVKNVLDDLQLWYESVPRDGRPLSLDKTAASTSLQRHIAISTAFQYHEAVMATLSPLAQALRPSSLRLQSSLDPASPASTILMESVKSVLAMTSHVSDFLNDRYFATPFFVDCSTLRASTS